MSEKSSSQQSDDGIDLVEIIAVILKRKWIIIGFLLVAIILSGIYVAFFMETYYKANIIISPPQEFEANPNGQLIAKNTQLNILLFHLKNTLNTNRSGKRDIDQKYSYEITTNLKGYILANIDPTNQIIPIQINIMITGHKEKIKEVIASLYNTYSDFVITTDKKNKHLFKISQNFLDNTLVYKSEMIKRYYALVNEDSLSKLPRGSENAILYMINTLSSDIMNIKIIIGLNDSSEEYKGSFAVRGGDTTKIIVKQESLNKIGTYIRPQKSKKRQLLPIMVSLVLALFVGLFLVFVIDFFSQEDVKKRFKEIRNK